MMRRKTIPVAVGGVVIGGDAPILVQSMTNTDTADVAATVAQIAALVGAGSELVRVTVNNEAAATAIPAIKEELMKRNITAPLVGDFHFNGHILLKKFPACAEFLDKYRINPGTVGSGVLHDKNFSEMIEAALRTAKPVRISANWGSTDRELLTRNMERNARRKKPKSDRAVLVDTLVESVIISAKRARMLGMAEDKIVVGVKVSEVDTVIEANRLLAKACNYPIHLGLTEAGTGTAGVVVSTTACSALLREGIGDTIRVSLTPLPGEPRTNEVKVARLILQAAGARQFVPHVTSCPGCGRTENDRYQRLAARVKEFAAARLPAQMRVAVMGCVVNGPGEAQYADVAISLPGRSEQPMAVVFVKGKPYKTLRGDKIEEEFLAILDSFARA